MRRTILGAVLVIAAATFTGCHDWRSEWQDLSPEERALQRNLKFEIDARQRFADFQPDPLNRGVRRAAVALRKTMKGPGIPIERVDCARFDRVPGRDPAAYGHDWDCWIEYRWDTPLHCQFFKLGPRDIRFGIVMWLTCGTLPTVRGEWYDQCVDEVGPQPCQRLVRVRARACQADKFPSPSSYYPIDCTSHPELRRDFSAEEAGD